MSKPNVLQYKGRNNSVVMKMSASIKSVDEEMEINYLDSFKMTDDSRRFDV